MLKNSAENAWRFLFTIAVVTSSLLFVGGGVLGVRPADAGCNIIPGTTKSFRGTLGTLDRPFAGRDTWVEINLGSPCHSASVGFSAQPQAHNVTVVFQPPNGPSNVVTLSADCNALAARLQACGDTPGVQAATCIPASVDLPPFDLDILDRDGERNLRFRFPDTDNLFPPAGDDHTLTGPAAIAVTAAADPLPCALATETCAQQTGLIACVDELYQEDGSCASVADSLSSHFTALPPANSYQSVCSDPSPPCLGTVDEIRFTTDRDGNILLPMDWRGVLLGNAVPVARLLRGSSALAAFSAGNGTIKIPGDGFLSSLSPEGGLLPPVFEPQSSFASQISAVLFGSTDATETVLRIERRSSKFTQCVGGTNDGLPCEAAGDCTAGGVCTTAVCVGGLAAGQICASDGDCADGECGPSLFEFRDRFEAGSGPVVVRRVNDAAAGEQGMCDQGVNALHACSTDAECPAGQCVMYTGGALDPVLLSAFEQTDTVSSFVVSEVDAGADFNGDGDAVDLVVTFKDRATGLGQALGAPDGCGIGATAEGRAITLVQQPPFSFPAIAVSGDYLAFLESEAGQKGCDENQDGDAADSVVRAFRLGQAAALTAGLGVPRVVDETPIIDGRSLAISNDLLFLRSAEVGGNIDYDGNGTIADNVLEVFDLATASMTTLCPAEQVSTAAGRAAFLRPESSTGTADCPAGSLNGDGDVSDLVVELWNGGGVAETMGKAAVRVALSDQWLGALVSEAGENGTDLNGDADTLDTVVALHDLSDPTPSWNTLSVAADSLDLLGSVAVFLTPESAQGGQDLNGDGDANDRVLQVYYSATGELLDLGQAAEEFVIGSGVVGLRTSEASQSVDLNGDGDMLDYILQLYDLSSRVLINTMQTVIPCNHALCDPRIPYRILKDTARFLSLEAAAGKDLNGDGDTDDVVVQIFNTAMALNNAAQTTSMLSNGLSRVTRTAAFGALVDSGMLTALSSVPARSPRSGDSAADDSGLEKLLGPLTGDDGNLAYASAGRCVEVFAHVCTAKSPCRSGEFCNDNGRCEREYGSCLGPDDCPPGAQCREDLIVATAADSDGDELPDPFDNCPKVANILQEDWDRDGVGDACESTCGNSVIDRGEQCDEGSEIGRMGRVCRPDCKWSLCGDPTGHNTISVASALYILRSAVGLVGCADCVCNIDGDGATSASDALLALNRAVGLEVGEFRCPRCSR